MKNGSDNRSKENTRKPRRKPIGINPRGNSGDKIRGNHKSDIITRTDDSQSAIGSTSNSDFESENGVSREDAPRDNTNINQDSSDVDRRTSTGRRNGSGRLFKRDSSRKNQAGRTTNANDDNSNVETDDTRQVKEISFDSLFDAVNDGKGFTKGLLPQVLKIVFSVPSLGGFGDHWLLEEDEAKALGAAIETALVSLPRAKKSQWLSFLKQYFPWISLLGTAATIVTPRLILTNMLRKQAYESQQRTSNQATNQSGGSYQTPVTAENIGNNSQYTVRQDANPIITSLFERIN